MSSSLHEEEIKSYFLVCKTYLGRLFIRLDPDDMHSLSG